MAQTEIGGLPVSIPEEFNTLSPEGTPTPFGSMLPQVGGGDESAMSILELAATGRLPGATGLPGPEDFQGRQQALESSQRALVRYSALFDEVQNVDLYPEPKNPILRLQNRLRRATDPTWEPRRRLESLATRVKLTSDIAKGIQEVSGVIEALRPPEDALRAEAHKQLIGIAAERIKKSQEFALKAGMLESTRGYRRLNGLPPMTPEQEEDAFNNFIGAPKADRDEQQQRIDAWMRLAESGFSPEAMLDAFGAEALGRTLGERGIKDLEAAFARGETDRKAKATKAKADAAESAVKAEKTKAELESESADRIKAGWETIGALVDDFMKGSSYKRRIVVQEEGSFGGGNREIRDETVHTVPRWRALQNAAQVAFSNDPQLQELLGEGVELQVELLRKYGGDKEQPASMDDIRLEFERRNASQR